MVLREPGVALLRTSVHAQVAADPQKRRVQVGPEPRRDVSRKPPFPGANSEQEILANIRYGVRASRLDAVSGYEALVQKGALAVRRILSVESDVTGDYHVVEFDTLSGEPFANVIVGKDGWLRLIGDARGGRPASAPNLDDVVRRLTRRFGPTRAKYYYAYNNVQGHASNESVPLIQAETPRGRILVDFELNMYTERLEKYKGSRQSETLMLGEKRRGETWLAKSDGIATLKLIGSLRGPQ